MPVCKEHKPSGYGRTFAVLPLVFFLVFVSGCAKETGGWDMSYYLDDTGKQKTLIKELWQFLSASIDEDERFALVREISNQYGRLNDNRRIITFLSEWINDHPNDPYNSYYLLRIADCYMREGSRPIAALYFDLIVRNYDDLIVRDNSIHLACLKQLIGMSIAPERKIWYYEQLIGRFHDDIDLGAAYFMQGQTCEQLGRWREAIAAYNNFLPFYGAVIPGFPDAYTYAKQMVDSYSIFKNHSTEQTKLDRTFESLPSLINAVKQALDDGDMYRLWRYRARVNFFARSWSQIGGDDEATDFNLSSLSAVGKIQYDDELSAGSGANDAYLKTWGWSKFTPIWYFYFRKIYFPMDPQINGRWEWAGFYYGERF
jgi:tetratricopeptide (TPR) repeat protein